MTQQSQKDLNIGWVGDSPNANAVAKKAMLPVGCNVKATTLPTRCDRNGSPPTPVSNRLRCATDYLLSDPATRGSSTSQDDRRQFEPGPSDFPVIGKLDILQRLKCLIMDKKPGETSGTSDSEPMIISDDTSCFDRDALPNTSTPTAMAVPLPRTDRSQITCSSRRKLPAKRHRLVLPDESLENSTAKEPAKIEDQNDDNSWLAGLDLEAIIKDAKQKRTSCINGASFKRFKTTGDLSDMEIQKNLKPQPVPVMSAVNRRRAKMDDDDDDIFQNPDFLADVDKLEQVVSTQRCKP